MTNAGKIEEATGTHTPLPWYAEGPDQFGDYNILHEGDALAIGAVVSNLRHPSEIAANAALIVRAVNAHPNLLSVLKQIEDFSSDPTSVRLARAAREYVGALP